MQTKLTHLGLGDRTPDLPLIPPNPSMRRLRQASSIDADAYWYLSLLGCPNYFSDLFRIADIAGVQTKPIDAGIQSLEGESIVEMDIGDDGNGDFLFDV